MASIVGQGFTTSRTSFVFDRYTDFGLFCHASSPDFNRDRYPTFL